MFSTVSLTGKYATLPGSRGRVGSKKGRHAGRMTVMKLGGGGGDVITVKRVREFEVQLDRPLGIFFAEKADGNLKVDELVEGGNGEKSGELFVGDVLVRCGPDPDNYLECEGKTFDEVMDVLGGFPDSTTMTVVVSRTVKEKEELDEDFSDAGGYWKRKREAKLRGPAEMRRSGGLTPKEIRVEKPIGGGSFGDVFSGTWNGDPIILKRCNARVFGAEELLEFEMALNDLIQERPLAKEACAKYIGCCEVSEREGGPLYEKLLPDGLWLVWADEGQKTLKSLMEADTKALTAVAKAFQIQGGDSRLMAIKTVVKQVLTSLKDIHAEDIIHRDVKPANLVFAEDEGKLKLIDLGASADLKTGLGLQAGPGPHDPLYCPPEQMLLPEDAPDPTVMDNLEGIREKYQPELFDIHAVGVIMMKLGCPFLASDDSITEFNAQLKECNHNIADWKEKHLKKPKGLFSKPIDEATIFGPSADDAWDLVSALLTPRGVNEGPPSAEAALKHPFLN